jgi:hypothetical protein
MYYDWYDDGINGEYERQRLDDDQRREQGLPVDTDDEYDDEDSL